MSRAVICLLVALLMVPGAAAQQPNLPVATMLLQGTTGSTFPILGVPFFGGTTATLDILGGANVAFMVVRAPHLTSPGQPFLGDLVDLDLSDPSALSFPLNGFATSPPQFKTNTQGVFSTSVLVPNNVQPNTQGAFQAVVQDPAAPFGTRMSAATSIQTFPGLTAVRYNLSRNSSVIVNTQNQWGISIPFYSTLYTRCFFASNGFITFVSGSSDFTPTNGEMHAAQPRIALYYTDLDPPSGGKVELVVDQINVFNPQLHFRYVAVPDWPSGASGGIGLHTVAAIIDIASGDIEMDQFPQNMNGVYDMMVGISAGGNLDPTGPGSMDLTATLSAGPYVGQVNEGMYEGWSGLTTVTGAFNLSHHYDMVGWFWKYSAVNAGLPGASYVMSLVPARTFQTFQ